MKPYIPTKNALNVIRDNINYDPYTGLLWWSKRGIGRRFNSPIGSDHGGYKRFRMMLDCKNRMLLNHRVAWFLYYKYWPTKSIDHINYNKSDNRIINLREVEYSQNLGRNPKRTLKPNTTSHPEYVGVYRIRSSDRWYAAILDEYLGSFDTAVEAAKAYDKRAKELRGNYAHQNIK